VHSFYTEKLETFYLRLKATIVFMKLWFRTTAPMTKVWLLSCTRTREQEFILKYFHFHLLSYRVDKTRFSSSGAARDCYVHLDFSPTFQFVLKKFLNVWNAILIYITLDVFVVNVLPCHVIHDEQRKLVTGKLVAATELESVEWKGLLPWCEAHSI